MRNHISLAGHWGLLLGRICVSLIFLLSSFDKIMNFSQISHMMAVQYGLAYSDYLLVMAIVMELGGSLLLILGLFTRLGAWLLFLFVIPVTMVFHTFWTYAQPEALNQMHHFMKNLSILGGLLYVMVYGGGKLSLDWTFWGKQEETGGE